MKQPITLQLIGNIPNSTALAHTIAETPSLYEKGLFVMVQHPTDRRIVAQTISVFAQNGPKPEILDPKILEWNGETILLPDLTQYDIVVADTKTIETTLLPAPSILKRQTLRFAQNESHVLASLKEQLTHMGYERDSTATRPGTFAIRGDILDIHTSSPYRISFFGDTIEKVEHLHGADLTHATQTDMPLYVAPLNAKGRSNFFDFIPAQAAVLSYDTTLPDSLTQTHAADHLIRAEVLAIADHAPRTTKKKRDESPEATNASYTLSRSYHMRRTELLEDIQNATRTIILAQEKPLIEALLTDNGKSPLPKNPDIYEVQANGKGFVIPAEKDGDAAQLLCLTESDLGIIEQRQKKASKKLQRALMQELSAGDYVVHMHHGIARFTGTTVMHVNNLDREYFMLEFAGKDKIYLPVELADRIDKYIGEEKPELQKLGGATWAASVVAVQEDVARVAQELLDIYARRSTATPHHIVSHDEERRLEEACPYDLTVDQADALQNIFDDMTREKPMDRLLCGDVGFGKTEVALRAAYRVVLNGYQAAVLAPTTILTQQHFDTFAERLGELGVRVGALSRFQSSAEQHEVIKGLAAGTIDIVVGTHRLFSDDVRFEKLGLIVIDEEQRFGVKAKESLTALRAQAHVLTMTATPIPRTLHLSLSGVREISTILTPPNERKAVELSIVPQNNDVIRAAVSRELERGGQVYYVYNRVQSIERRRMELQSLLGDKVRIGVVHGQMPPAALAKAMHDFDTKQIDLLLASSIVENGLDIASANTMLVENASMFGLAELYQLKGRVGRSRDQGYAVFFYKERELDGDVKQRFLALQAADGLGDGFELAMRDMEIRGVGNMLGKAQSGHTSKIGLHLYVRLLNTAVQQLQGKTVETIREVNIDVPIEGRIPEELIPDTEERIGLYQHLAGLVDEQEISDARRELTGRDTLWEGDALHPAVEGLLQLIKLKVLAGRSTLTGINTDYPNTSNRLQHERIGITSSDPLPDLPEAWERIYEGRDPRAFKARASIDALGGKENDKWLEEIKNIIRLCSGNESK